MIIYYFFPAHVLLRVVVEGKMAGLVAVPVALVVNLCIIFIYVYSVSSDHILEKGRRRNFVYLVGKTFMHIYIYTYKKERGAQE